MSRLPKIPILAWIATTVVLLLISGVLLRENNFRMGELRESIYTFDAAGDEFSARQAVEDLQEYTEAHMNTDVGGEIHLANSYAQVVASTQEAFYSQDEVSGGLYREAQEECEDPSILLSLRAECVQSYVEERSSGEVTISTEIEYPDPNDYIFSFTSPSWSPDLAGLFLAVSVVAGSWTALRVVIKGVYS